MNLLKSDKAVKLAHDLSEHDAGKTELNEAKQSHDKATNYEQSRYEGNSRVDKATVAAVAAELANEISDSNGNAAWKAYVNSMFPRRLKRYYASTDF